MTQQTCGALVKVPSNHPKVISGEYPAFREPCSLPIEGYGPCAAEVWGPRVCGALEDEHEPNTHAYQPSQWRHVETVEEPGVAFPHRTPVKRVYENDAAHFGHPATPKEDQG